MQIARRFTTEGRDPYETVGFRSAASEIRNPDGSVVFSAEGVEVPSEWSQVACDILAQKYLRKAGVPARLLAVEEDGVPHCLWRRKADTEALASLPKAERSGGETSAKQCFDRLAGTWTYWGWKGGYFDSEADAGAFYDEIRVMLARQMGAPNSPQWFNTGLYWAYGIDGPAQGHYYVDHRTGKVRASDSAYEHPQPHACFIQSVADDLVNEGGIMDLWVREARLFKYGSGTGSNFSKLRARRRETVGRRQIIRPDELSEDRRPGRRRDQIGRHDAPRRQDGHRRRRPPRYRAVYRLEGRRGAEGRRAGRRLETGREAPEPDHEGVPRGPGRWRRGPSAHGLDPWGPVRSDAEPRPEARNPSRAARDDPGKLYQARHPARPPGRRRDRLPHLRHGLGIGSLCHRRRAEREQHGARRQRFPRTGRIRQRLAADPPHRRRGDEDPAGIGAMGQDRARRLGLGRSRAAIRHDDQRLAHLPGERPDQRLEPVLGIHVSRRHGVQSRLAEPAGVPDRGRRLRGRGFPPRSPPVDNRARNLGHDGAVPVAGDRAAQLCLSHAGPRLRQSRRAADGLGHSL